MLGLSGVSHEWDTLAFGLSTIPAIASLLLVGAASWEQWRRRPPITSIVRSDRGRVQTTLSL